MPIVWVPFQIGLAKLSFLANETNTNISTFVFGVIERALIPFGLHHIFYSPFWYQFGEYTNSAGQIVNGDQAIWFAMLKDGVTNFTSATYQGAGKFLTGKYPFMMFGLPAAALAMYHEAKTENKKKDGVTNFTSATYQGAGKFLTGKYPFMMFGLPAAALAMYHEAKTENKKIVGGILFSAALTSFLTGITEPLEFSLMFGLPAAALAMYHEAKTENKKIVGGILFSAALTSFLTGITEPLEFSFLFVAPVLYGIHCIFAGLSFMLMNMFSVRIGMTFSGGLIDYIVFGVLPGTSGFENHWYMVIIIGLVFSVIYYFGFRFAIRKFRAY